MTFARCCIEHARPLAEDPEHDTLTCVVTGRSAVIWHVVDLTTGERLALATRLEGAVAVSERAGAGFDPEEWFRDLLDRDTDRDVVARATVPASPPPSAWPFMTRG